MNNYFENILASALFKCEGIYTKDDDVRQGFSRLYPFTTENISGYIDKFDLNGKSLLTVGSSGDQVINASLFNCVDQTVVDICPYTKFYFYLKKACILSFSLKEFMDFFCYNDYPKFCHDNKDVFSKEKFEGVKDLIRVLDYESYLFWDEVFSLYKPEKVRRELFSSDEDRSFVLQGMNLYMKDEEAFSKAKVKIRGINPKFICEDIFKVNLNRTYDNVFLSNIGLYCGIDRLKELVGRLEPYVDDKMLLCYLYKTEENTKYKKDWSEIYDLKRLKSSLGEYITSFDTFCGVRGILFEDEKYDRDSVLIYEKRR